MQDDIEAIASVVVDEAYHIHREIGPGLLESGLLINFGLPVFKDGCARVVNGPNDFSTSPLRINQAKKRFPTP